MRASVLRILVIGGGIGGLCLAQGLRHIGLQASIYERNPPDFWPVGYRIHINPVGARALHACLPTPLWNIFTLASGLPPAGLGFLTEQLDELVVIGKHFMGETENGPLARHYPINRHTLRQILLSGLDSCVHYHKTFERYTTHPDGTVIAHFSDGSSAVGDLLVGADGANSRVRQQYLPQAQRVTLGAAAIAGVLPLSHAVQAWAPPALLTRLNLIQALSSATLFIAPYDHPRRSNSQVATLREAAHATGLDADQVAADGESYLLWALIAHATSFPAQAEAFGGKALVEYAGQRITGWHPLLRRLVAESDPSRVVFNHFKASRSVTAWPPTSVTLLGDAIHNMPPVGGLGGNMALHDARALVQQLGAVQRGERLLLKAVHRYETQMRTAGYAALESSLRHTRQAAAPRGLSRLAARSWFRACGLLPALQQIFETEWTRPMRNQAA